VLNRSAGHHFGYCCQDFESKLIWHRIVVAVATRTLIALNFALPPRPTLPNGLNAWSACGGDASSNERIGGVVRRPKSAVPPAWTGIFSLWRSVGAVGGGQLPRPLPRLGQWINGFPLLSAYALLQVAEQFPTSPSNRVIRISSIPGHILAAR
jgi:hypothetical protein